MVMSIEEQIASLEEQLANVKGKGAKAKKEELQSKINELKASIEDTEEEKSEQKEEEKSEQIDVDDDTPVIDTRPMPTNWVKVTPQEVTDAEKKGKLVGFDPKKMIALIRD